MNKWVEFMCYMNKRLVGDIIVRKDIIAELSKGNTTIDNYRNVLTQGGFLRKTDTLGQYEVVKSIDFKNLTLREAKLIAYDYEYRTNYIRYEKLSKILYE